MLFRSEDSNAPCNQMLTPSHYALDQIPLALLGPNQTPTKSQIEVITINDTPSPITRVWPPDSNSPFPPMSPAFVAQVMASPGPQEITSEQFEKARIASSEKRTTRKKLFGKAKSPSSSQGSSPASSVFEKLLPKFQKE